MFVCRPRLKVQIWRISRWENKWRILIFIIKTKVLLPLGQCDFRRFWLYVYALWLYCSQIPLNWIILLSNHLTLSWWILLHKRSVRTKLDIYILLQLIEWHTWLTSLIVLILIKITHMSLTSLIVLILIEVTHDWFVPTKLYLYKFNTKNSKTKVKQKYLPLTDFGVLFHTVLPITIWAVHRSVSKDYNPRMGCSI